MSTEIDEKGKFFTDVISKNITLAKIQTTTHQIIGEIHVSPNNRLKDELDVSDAFLAVTNATISTSNRHEIICAKFIAVQREQIVWVMAMKDEMEGGKA